MEVVGVLCLASCQPGKCSAGKMSEVFGFSDRGVGMRGDQSQGYRELVDRGAG